MFFKIFYAIHIYICHFMYIFTYANLKPAARSHIFSFAEHIISSRYTVMISNRNNLRKIYLSTFDFINIMLHPVRHVVKEARLSKIFY